MKLTIYVYEDGSVKYDSDYLMPTKLEHGIRKSVEQVVKQFYERKDKKYYDIVVAIDADITQNGYACYHRKTHTLTLAKYDFPSLLQILSTTQKMCEQNELNYIVVVEAGYKNGKVNLHYFGNNTGVASKVGYHVGENHTTAKKIVEMCRYWKIPVEEKAPLKKIWGADKKSKISAEEFAKLTGYNKRTNQDVRDAGLLCWVSAGLPIG